ncbi:ferritin-like domain-containing protein [Larkinella sp. VNQ87]|uniref:ferritin-like domain-containing protein n=1 Tax=Larkinella sp. VNQ87 TaxID=3400921 RepID=UPI003C0DFA59
MEKLNNIPQPSKGPTIPAIPSVERRMFLRSLGLASASALAILSSCSREELTPPKDGIGRSGARVGASVLPDGTIDLGEGDIAISNLAYTLDQLEVAFYSTAYEKSVGWAEADRKVLRELRDHELVHREFFKALLGPNAIPELEFVFNGIDFNNRNAVFDAAQKFETVGVGAFNGSSKFVMDLELIKLAGKLVSVEARHATLARHMILPESKFAIAHELIDSNGLDVAYFPPEVLMKAQPYIKQKLTISKLPAPL